MLVVVTMLSCAGVQELVGQKKDIPIVVDQHAVFAVVKGWRCTRAFWREAKASKKNETVSLI